jgi:hypothetical protein
MVLQRDDYQPGQIERIAHDLRLRYGPTAPRVAREWAEIKGQQGAPETAAMWRRIADAALQAADA